MFLQAWRYTLKRIQQQDGGDVQQQDGGDLGEHLHHPHHPQQGFGEHQPHLDPHPG